MIEQLKSKLLQKSWGYKEQLYNKFFEFALDKRITPNQPEISIVVISWRLHPDTIRNFEALKKQRDNESFELIFVDNGGKEGEFKELEQYTDVYIRLNQNTGACIARNIGSLYSEGPVLLFLEDDGIPDESFVKSHLLMHRYYDILALRGVYLFKTENSLNDRQNWYYLGDRHFPMFPNIEGNTSIQTSAFFEIGGWNDDIVAGGEGKDLSIRLFRKYPNPHLQVYSPLSVIYHDYAVNEEHLTNKLDRTEKSHLKLKSTYPEWDDYSKFWRTMFGQSHLLKKRELIGNDGDNLINSLYREVYNRNSELINHSYNQSKVYTYDKEKLNSIFINIASQRKIGVFGASAHGEKVMQALLESNVKVDFFFDNNEALWGGEKNGIPIISPAEISTNNFIFIASTWFYEIAKQLEGLGLQRCRDFYSVI